MIALAERLPSGCRPADAALTCVRYHDTGSWIQSLHQLLKMGSARGFATPHQRIFQQRRLANIAPPHHLSRKRALSLSIHPFELQARGFNFRAACWANGPATAHPALPHSPAHGRSAMTEHRCTASASAFACRMGCFHRCETTESASGSLRLRILERELSRQHPPLRRSCARRSRWGRAYIEKHALEVKNLDV